MATVKRKQNQPGEKVFGGAGAAVFRPYPKTQWPSRKLNWNRRCCLQMQQKLAYCDFLRRIQLLI